MALTCLRVYRVSTGIIKYIGYIYARILVHVWVYSHMYSVVLTHTHIDIADALLRLGADVRTQDSAGHSVLVAVAMGVRDGLIEAAHLENSVVFWLDHDADIEHITRGRYYVLGNILSCTHVL